MINSTARKHQEAPVLSLCSANMGFQRHYNPLISLSVNAILSLVALLGNILILIALQKVSSLHPPSKLLLRCLSTTDLCVGLISQPLRIVYRATLENKNWRGVCGITEALSNTSNAVMCGESITILTAISVDRLLALMLGLRYRQVVTLKRIRLFVIYSWIQSLAFPLTYLWDKRLFYIWGSAWIFFCLTISTCCYLKIYMIIRHQQAQVGDETQGNSFGASAINMARYKKTVTKIQSIVVTVRSKMVRPCGSFCVYHNATRSFALLALGRLSSYRANSEIEVTIFSLLMPLNFAEYFHLVYIF